MQTQQVLPIQIQGASATPNKAGGASQSGGNEFSQALFDSRQAMRNQAQARSHGAPPPRQTVQEKPAVKQPDASARPTPGSEDHVAKAAQEAATSGASAEVPASQGTTAPAQSGGDAAANTDAQARIDAQAKADAEAAAAADASAITPMADMLALMAAFNQPAQAVADAAASAQAGAAADPRSLTVNPADAAAAAAAAEAAALAGAAADDSSNPAAGAADAAALAAAKAGAADRNAVAAAGDEGANDKGADTGAIKLDAAALAAQEAIDPATVEAAKQALSKQAAPLDSAFARQLAQAGEAKPAEPGVPGAALPQSGLKLETALRSTRTETGAGDAAVDTATTDVKPEIKPLAAGVNAAYAQAKPEVAVQHNAPRAEAADLSAVREAAPQPASFQQAVNTSLQAAQAANVAAGDRIPARVGTPAWDNQVTQKVIFMAAGGEQSASLTLNPPELGPMQVVLSVSNDTTNVTFSAAQPEVRQALENSMPKLREMLAESGISLGNANVNAGLPDQSQAQANGDARSGGSQGGGHGQGRFNNSNNVAGADLPSARPARRNENGLVDTFA